MPGLFNEQEDEEPLSDWQRGFAGGMVSALPPDEVTEGAACYLGNVDLFENRAVTRRGAEQLTAGPVPGSLIQGQCWFETPDLALQVVVAGGAGYSWDGSAWTSIGAYAAADGQRRVSIVQLVDQVFIADGVAHLFSWDGTTLTDLGTGSTTQPGLGRLLCAHTNRLFMAGFEDDPDRLDASDILDGTLWNNVTQSIRIGDGDGDPIIGLCAWDKFTLLVFKRRSIWALQADPTFPASSWTAQKVSGSIGCVAERTITYALQDVLFLSDSGVRTIQRVLAGDTTATSDALSAPVQDVFDALHWDAIENASAVFYRDKWLLSVPMGTSSRPDTLLVLDVKRKVWAGIWSGWNAQTWAVVRDSGGLRLTFGREDGSLWRWRDYVPATTETELDYRDAGAGYETRVLTRGMIFGDAENPKAPFRVEGQFYKSLTSCSVSAVLDRGSAVPLGAGIVTQDGLLLLPFTLPATLPRDGVQRWGRCIQHLRTAKVMQFELVSATDKLAVRGVVANAFVETVDIDP